MDAGDKEILNDFKRTRQKTIDLLAGIPPSMLGEKADGEDLTMGELFHHIAATVDGWMARCMQDGGDLPPRYKASKPAIVRALQSSQRRLLKYFNAKKGTAMKAVYRPKRKGKKYRFVGRDRVLYLTQHEAHHRGKIVLALRQWGFTEIPYLPY
ncbi:MAG: DinB family protein [Phycisphaerales bacterium]|nr:DinB family protein [Phycisphaerales bacterium]MCI0631677.1 DinB family protein [Phycisphaerales bacterium]MCI0677025.1 DinB family protein [Phycisphaerales bacterium]